MILKGRWRRCSGRDVGFGSKTEVAAFRRDVCFAPVSELRQAGSACPKSAINGPTRRLAKCERKRTVFRTEQTDSLDDLIRPFEQLLRNCRTNCPSRLEIEYQYRLLQDLDWQVTRFGAP